MNHNSGILGVDVSSESLDIYHSKTGEYSTIANSEKHIIEFLSKFNINKLKVLYEATGVYSSWLLKVCNTMKIEHHQIHPMYMNYSIKGSGNKNKNDKIDAKMICILGKIYMEEMGNTTLPSSNMIKSMTSKVSRINSIKSMQTRYKNLIHKETKDAFLDVETLEFYNEEVKRLDTQINTIFKQLEEEIVSNKLENKIINLQTIPGIGKETALMLLIFFIDMAEKGIKPGDTGKIKAYAGINPVERKSGTSLNQVKLAKTGRPRVRKLLFMPALQWMKLVSKEKYARTNIGQFVIRMREKFETDTNKRGKSVSSAVMKKILLTGWGIFWSDEKYNYN